MRILRISIVCLTFGLAASCSRSSKSQDAGATSTSAGNPETGSATVNTVIDSARSAKLYEQVVISGEASSDPNFVSMQLSNDWFMPKVGGAGVQSSVGPVLGLRGVNFDKTFVKIPYARELALSQAGSELAVAVTDGVSSKVFTIGSVAAFQEGMTGFVPVSIRDGRKNAGPIAMGVVLASTKPGLALVADKELEIDVSGFSPAASVGPQPDDIGGACEVDNSVPAPVSSAAPVAEASASLQLATQNGPALSPSPQTPGPAPSSSFSPWSWGDCAVDSQVEADQLQLIRTCFGRAQTPEGAGGGYLGNIMGRPKCTDVGPYVLDQVRKCVKDGAAQMGKNPNLMVFQPCSIFRHGWIGGHEYMGICRVNNGAVTKPQLCAWTDPWQALDSFYEPGTGVHRPAHEVSIAL